MEMGLVGIWIAMAMDECVRAVIFIYRWRSGAWKKRKLIEV
jgi:Na+-driven multidrug efflux pump